MSKMRLTKLEAARRQLETAIDLYFRNGDPVSIETLTSAAEQIIEDISQSRLKASLWENVFLQYVIEEKQDYVRRELRKPRNFFKHANLAREPWSGRMPT